MTDRSAFMGLCRGPVHVPALLLQLSVLFTMLGTASPLHGQAGSPLVGLWGEPEYAMTVPEPCLEATFEFGADGSVEVRSGAQIVTGSYTLEEMGDDAFLVVQSDLQVNDEPNCQGMEPEAVLANYVQRLYLVVEEDTVRVHMGESSEAPSFTMVRLEG